jgi:hypothetical protein
MPVSEHVKLQMTIFCSELRGGCTCGVQDKGEAAAQQEILQKKPTA